MTLDTLIIVAVGLAVVLLGAAGWFFTIPSRAVKREWKNLSWEEKEQFSKKALLLEHSTIVDAYAPAAEYQKPFDSEKKKRLGFAAWSSPYPKAVKRAWKRARKDSPSVLTMVKEQIAAAAESITLETLPEDLQPHNGGVGHFLITLQLNGMPESQVRGLAATIQSQLKLLPLVPTDNGGDNGVLRFVAHEEAPIDKLEAQKWGLEFFEANPLKRFSSIPLAVRPDGSAWSLSTLHTLVYGLTGAGKNSVLMGILFQVAELVRGGLTKVYMVDPKGDFQLRLFENSGFVESYTRDEKEAVNTIHYVLKLLEDRSNEWDSSSLDDWVPTKRDPMILLVIDELMDLLVRLPAKQSAAATSALTSILAKGRFLGVFVVAASQSLEKELLGRMRGNFVNKIALRAENSYWSDLVLGEGSASQGFDASLIRLATAENGWATSGIGYVKEESGEPTKVRFAFLSKQEVRDFAHSFPLNEGDALGRAEQSQLMAALKVAEEASPIVSEPVVSEPERPVSVADELARIAGSEPVAPVKKKESLQEMPTPKLRALEAKLVKLLAERENAGGRNLLENVGIELRRRDALEGMPKFVEEVEADDSGEVSLPALNFGGLR